MTELHWVIGATGLLGSGVALDMRIQGERQFEGPAISWGTPEAALDLARGLADFIGAVGGDPWTIYWCAGVSTTGSPPEALAAELAVLASFLDAIGQYPPTVLSEGALFLASSAGAVYGGAEGAPFTEDSMTSPLGSYGEAKLAAEDRVRAFSVRSGVVTVVGRIANLYGPGQKLSKSQGLISRLCISSLTRTPLSVFVPMDTLRDYVYVDDCARLITSAVARARERRSIASFHLKVISSGRSVSIGALLGQFKQVARVRPYIVLGQSAESSLQGRDLRLQSTYWPDLDELAKVNLADGISRTMEDVRSVLINPQTGRPPRALA
jgi:UDP-glucose 4-epimerase